MQFYQLEQTNEAVVFANYPKDNVTDNPQFLPELRHGDVISLLELCPRIFLHHRLLAFP